MIKVYAGNRPPLQNYAEVDVLNNLNEGEIQHIANETGNHWRKIFNVYAKFMFELAGEVVHQNVLAFDTWQAYRDGSLLQSGSDTELHLDNSATARALNNLEDGCVRIVMGKAYGESLLAWTDLKSLDADFAVSKKGKVIVCPYFDYRQLSNLKITRLVTIVVELMGDQ